MKIKHKIVLNIKKPFLTFILKTGHSNRLKYY